MLIVPVSSVFTDVSSAFSYRFSLFYTMNLRLSLRFIALLNLKFPRLTGVMT